jgi:hypothetical protein
MLVADPFQRTALPSSGGRIKGVYGDCHESFACVQETWSVTAGVVPVMSPHARSWAEFAALSSMGGCLFAPLMD